MRRIGPVLLALTMITVAHLWVPRPVVACSCASPEVAIDSAGRNPGSSVFTATAGVRVGDSIPVTITRWFKGVPPAGPAIIEGDDPLSMCGPTSPPAGGHYLFVTYTSPTSRLAISGCSVQADLATSEGAGLLGRATELFGPGTAPPMETPSPPTQAAEPDPGSFSLATLVPVLAASVAAIGALLGLVLVLARRRGSP